ncbi:methylated-DNA--[protein]-cysteine S-methyltransferase [Gimesia aquarii]|uniref:methylated-DNA--[protein]-cysteine S-methyltransferase n=1 Tax=Gimesia aquarii TaxID=2527964 RepID=A0A517WSP5_9PLAN|nr:MGMT family protein [Gimesia aquarii]QDU08287.1 Methylated-DNA--protein-cysteine methyltransferase [Gimesia aquarii]
MGQRTVSVPKSISKTAKKGTSNESFSLKLSIFSTEIGWCGLMGNSEGVERLLMGHHSAADVRQAAKQVFEEDHNDSINNFEETNWFPDLSERLQDYYQGAVVEFRDVKVSLPHMTKFQARVIRELKKIGYGKQITYGELATKAGAPRAARAVGTVMSTNRIPIIIPCHRVVASGGKLGGFSSPQGTSLKQHLLTLESEAIQ